MDYVPGRTYCLAVLSTAVVIRAQKGLLIAQPSMRQCNTNPAAVTATGFLKFRCVVPADVVSRIKDIDGAMLEGETVLGAVDVVGVGTADLCTHLKDLIGKE